MPEFTDMLETMTDPAMRHAALVHLPVALALMGLVLAVILAVVRGRSARLAALTAVVFALLALASWAAVASGTDAKAGLGSQATHAQQLVAEHEWMARRLWILALAAAGVAGFGLIPQATARAIASALALVAGVAVVAWVALTAHQGGTLVYRHAAGVARAQPPADVVRVETPDARVAFYHEHVAPLLADRCLGCHGSNEPAAGIDLGSIASLLGGGSGRPIVVPGRPDDSLLIQAVMWEDELKMPPPHKDGSGRLEDESIELLRRWIFAGAAWAPSPAAVDADCLASARSHESKSPPG